MQNILIALEITLRQNIIIMKFAHKTESPRRSDTHLKIHKSIFHIKVEVKMILRKADEGKNIISLSYRIKFCTLILSS